MKVRLFAVIAATSVVIAGIAYVFMPKTVTVDAFLETSGQNVTDLVRITAYETILPNTPNPDLELERYARIENAGERGNEFRVPRAMTVGFWVDVTGPDIAPTAFQPEGWPFIDHALFLSGGIVQLNVVSDGASEFFVQAEMQVDDITFVSYGRGVPGDGQMVFLLPDGEWTFSAVGEDLGQPLVVQIEDGEIIDATLDTIGGR